MYIYLLMQKKKIQYVCVIRLWQLTQADMSCMKFTLETTKTDLKYMECLLC